MKIVEKGLEELKPYENNPRVNDDAVEFVANSIKEFGFKVPIVVDKDGVIVAGHTRSGEDNRSARIHREGQFYCARPTNTRRAYNLSI